jgi:hypothetical protein
MSGYYWGTAGWQDAAAQSPSREKAIREASDGTLSKRLSKVLDFVYRQGTIGATFRDIDEALGTHHGQSSGALTNLHKQGKIARLAVYRKPGQPRCSVYVHAAYADMFDDNELYRTPTETKSQRLVREARELERVIVELRDEIAHLKRRLRES